MPTNTKKNQTVEMNIRFNKALQTFRYFAGKWDGIKREILVMQITKGLKEAKTGDKNVAAEYLTKALYERFHNDRDDQFYWGLKGQQYLGEAIHHFVPVAILCQPNHLEQIHQFCQEICPQPTIITEQKATPFQKGMDAYRQRTCLFSH